MDSYYTQILRALWILYDEDKNGMIDKHEYLKINMVRHLTQDTSSPRATQPRPKLQIYSDMQTTTRHFLNREELTVTYCTQVVQRIVMPVFDEDNSLEIALDDWKHDRQV